MAVMTASNENKESKEWEDQPATKAQKDYLLDLANRANQSIDVNVLTKKEASNKIDQLLAKP